MTFNHFYILFICALLYICYITICFVIIQGLVYTLNMLYSSTLYCLKVIQKAIVRCDVSFACCSCQRKQMWLKSCIQPSLEKCPHSDDVSVSFKALLPGILSMHHIHIYLVFCFNKLSKIMQKKNFFQLEFIKKKNYCFLLCLFFSLFVKINLATWSRIVYC